MELATVYNQPEEVDSSVGAFLLNLGEAIAIVIVVLLVFMGVVIAALLIALYMPLLQMGSVLS